jgi:hypothetical protein
LGNFRPKIGSEMLKSEQNEKIKLKNSSEKLNREPPPAYSQAQ